METRYCICGSTWTGPAGAAEFWADWKLIHSGTDRHGITHGPTDAKTCGRKRRTNDRAVCLVAS